MGNMNPFSKLKIRSKLISTHLLSVLICIGLAYIGLPIYVIAAIGVVATCLIAFFVSNDLASNVEGPISVINRRARGELPHGPMEIRKKTKLRGDEFSTFAYAFDALDSYLVEVATVAEHIAAGDLTIEVTPKSPKDEVSASFAKMIHSLRNAIGQVAENTNEMASSTDGLEIYSRQAGESTQQIAMRIQQVARGAGERELVAPMRAR
jgi:methyl-accepting chemotaxis protein